MDNVMPKMVKPNFVNVWGRRVLFATLLFFLWWPVWQLLLAEVTGFFLVSRQVLFVFTCVFLFEILWCVLLQISSVKNKGGLKLFFKEHKELWCLVFILAWGFVSSCFALDPLVAFFGKSGEALFQLEAYWAYVCYAVIFVVALWCIPKDRQTWIVYSFFAMLAVVGLFTMIDPKGEIFFAFQNHTSTWAGMFVNSNHFAYLLCMAVVGSAYLYASHAKVWARYIWLLSFLFFTILLIYNNTLGSYIAVLAILLCMMCVYAWKHLHMALQMAMSLGCVVLLGFVLDNGVMSQAVENMVLEALRIITSLLGIHCSFLEGASAPPMESLGTNRWGLWILSFANIVMYPLFGVGVQCYALANPTATSSRPHNEFLQFTGEMGVPVGIVYIVLIVLVIRKYALQTKHSVLQNVTFWMLCTYVISSLFGNTMPHTVPYVCILFAILETTFTPVLPKKERKLLAKYKQNEYIYYKAKQKGI